jgi:hypothetical protein
MNFAIGASGLRPKAFNRSSEIEVQCPQLKHSIAIRFMPPMLAIFCGLYNRAGIEVLSHAFIGWMPKLPRSGQRAKFDIDQHARLEPSRFRLLNLAGVRMVVRKADILLHRKMSIWTQSRMTPAIGGRPMS